MRLLVSVSITDGWILLGKQRVPRTRAGGKYTEAGYFGWIRSNLRRAFQKYPVKFQVKQAGRRRSLDGKRTEYLCNHCGNTFRDKDIQVDHIKPAGSLKSYEDLPAFVENLFCEIDGLQLLCKPCHQVKTNAEKEERKTK